MKNMRSFIAAVVACGALVAAQSASAVDAFEGFVSINGTYYDTDLDVGGLDAFAGHVFTINAGDALNMGGDVKTTPGGGVTDGADDVNLNWKVYLGAGPDLNPFTAQHYAFDINPAPGVDKWAATATGGQGLVDVAAGLAPGTYTLEVYWSALDHAFGGIDYVNNGGANYKATINVIPEPSTGMLVGLGLLGALAFRRRKA
jgi:hypothetical protein